MKKYSALSATLLAAIFASVFITGCDGGEESQSKAALLNPPAERTVPVAEADWITNYDQALNIARKEGRRVLINFTGSDWCGWCIRLKKEVFDMPEFKSYASDKLVLLEIDFPRRKQLPAGDREANEKLMQKFGVRGFPTLFLLNSDGKAIGQLGYIPGGPKAFISAIESAEG